MSKLLLIDGNNLFHRAYHALPPLHDKSGENSNAVYGFSNMLLKAVSEIKPDYIACAFDTAAPTFRHIEFEKYKAQRPPAPPDLYPQLPKVRKVLDAFGISHFEKAGYEADDLLASAADYFLKNIGDCDIVILSGDRDALQLVDGRIKVQMPGWNLLSATLFGADQVKEKYGIAPEQMVDYKSLIGDVSDNIPGVAGVGPKTASSLLQLYGDLENLYKHIDEIPGKVKEKLLLGKDLALAAKRLVELDKTIDMGIDAESLKFNPDWNRVRDEFEDLGFKSIANKISSQGAVRVEEPLKQEKNNSNSDQMELI